jgi:hypothetical protein
MSHGTTSRGVAGLILGAAVLALLGNPAKTSADPAHHPVSIDIKSVLAADTNEGYDEGLGSLSRPLGMLFHYSTYKLLSHEIKGTECGRMLSFSLPGGRILQVEPRSIEGNMIELEVVLFQGERPQLSTDFHMMNRGQLLLGGPRFKQGMLIISIGAQTNLPRHGEHRRIPLSASSPHPEAQEED